MQYSLAAFKPITNKLTVQNNNNNKKDISRQKQMNK